MIELHISLAEDGVYNILSDGCHEIIYQTGACFEWKHPEPPGFAVARFSFRTEAQGQVAVKMLLALMSRVAPSKSFLIIGRLEAAETRGGDPKIF